MTPPVSFIWLAAATAVQAVWVLVVGRTNEQGWAANLWPAAMSQRYAAWTWYGSPLSTAAIFASVLCIVAPPAAPWRAAAALLRAKTLQRAAALTYPFYLIHTQAAFVAGQAVPDGVLSDLARTSPLAAFAAVTALTVAAGVPAALLLDLVGRYTAAWLGRAAGTGGSGSARQKGA